MRPVRTVFGQRTVGADLRGEVRGPKLLYPLDCHPYVIAFGLHLIRQKVQKDLNIRSRAPCEVRLPSLRPVATCPPLSFVLISSVVEAERSAARVGELVPVAMLTSRYE